MGPLPSNGQGARQHVVLRGRLIALAHSATSFALALVHTQFQPVPLLPRPKKQNAPRSLRCRSEKTKILVQG